MRRKRSCVALWFWIGLLTTGAAAADPLRFCITADNRNYPGFVSVLEQIKKTPGGPGAFMVSPGDVVPAKGTRQNLDKVFGESFAWYPLVGNHEITPKDEMAYLRDYYDKRLKGKVNPGPEGAQQTTYSLDAGDVHIVAINQYWDGKNEPNSDSRKNAGVVGPLREWLKADLKAAGKPWKLVFGHEPAFPQPDKDWTGIRHASDVLTKHPEDRDAFWAILEEHGVAAYICGHTHRYSRYQPERSKVWQIDAAQARGGNGWKYDAFIIVTADRESLKFDVYRNLKEQGKFEVTDTLTLKPPGPQNPRATTQPSTQKQ
jgi:hypothetical protein